MLYRLSTCTLFFYHAYTTDKCSIHITIYRLLKVGLTPIITFITVVLA